MYTQSSSLSAVLREAKREAGDLGEWYVSTEHLLLGLTDTPESRAAEYLAARQITLESLRDLIHRSRCGTRTPPVSAVQTTPRAERVLHLALNLSVEAGCSAIGTHHLLAALLLEGEGLAAIVLRGAGLEPETLKSEVIVLACE